MSLGSFIKSIRDGEARTGDDLLDFVNNSLFPRLKNIEITAATTRQQAIVRSAFQDNNNYMKDGVLLRKVVNIIDELELSEHEDRHAFGEIYETILRNLQSAGSSGEFYTPRAVTDFMVQMIEPKLGESIADFACGTGGFLTSALNVLDGQAKDVKDRELYRASVFGIEKKALPFLLCSTNMLFFDSTGPTRETWFYRLDKPDGCKHFSKTKPMKLKHFAPAIEWWHDRREIAEDGFDKTKKYTAKEIASCGYNIDLCGYPHAEAEILAPRDLIANYQERRASMNAEIDRILGKIGAILGDRDI